MKRIFLIAITGILISSIFVSCTEDDVEGLLYETQSCCGTGEDPPPPPPPPPGGDGNGG